MAGRARRQDDPATDRERLARGFLVVIEAARERGYENGLKWRDRDARCLYDDPENPQEEAPHRLILDAYREAWRRGSARAMGAKAAPSAPLVGQPATDASPTD